MDGVCISCHSKIFLSTIDYLRKFVPENSESLPLDVRIDLCQRLAKEHCSGQLVFNYTNKEDPRVNGIEFKTSHDYLMFLLKFG